MFDSAQMRPELFLPILQKGFRVRVPLNITIHRLLKEQFGLAEAYIENRIKTAFLDGKPVDDFKTALVGPGSALALSAAMPGLVGAVFRRGGTLSSFRETISHKNTETIAGDYNSHETELETGFIFVKLFNLLVKEIGPAFLKRGIYISPHNAEFLFQGRSEDLLEKCTSIKLEKNKLSRDQFSFIDWTNLESDVLIKWA